MDRPGMPGRGYASNPLGTDVNLGSTTATLFLLVLGLTAGMPAAPAPADDEYPASVVTATELTVHSPVRSGKDSWARARVTSDVEGETPTGSVEFSVAGEVFATEPLNPGGMARVTVPADLLEPGTNTVSADYVPEPDSKWLGSSDSAEVEVTCRADCATAPAAEQPPAASQPADDETGLVSGMVSSPVTWGAAGLVLLGLGGVLLSRRAHG
jgi:hypothetical protein